MGAALGAVLAGRYGLPLGLGLSPCPGVEVFFIISNRISGSWAIFVVSDWVLGVVVRWGIRGVGGGSIRFHVVGGRGGRCWQGRLDGVGCYCRKACW